MCALLLQQAAVSCLKEAAHTRVRGSCGERNKRGAALVHGALGFALMLRDLEYLGGYRAGLWSSALEELGSSHGSFTTNNLGWVLASWEPLFSHV